MYLSDSEILTIVVVVGTVCVTYLSDSEMLTTVVVVGI